MISLTTSCADPPRSPPRFAATWIENWPGAIERLSFRQRGLCLTGEQTHALGRRNGVFAHCFAADSDASLTRLEVALDEALTEFPGGAFVRLGSRSPKDTPAAILTGCRAERGREAIALLTDRSRRVFYDLWRCVRSGYRPWIFLREWRDCQAAEEFRCFLLEGRLAGISQYHYGVTLPLEQPPWLDGIPAAMARMARILRQALGPMSVVFDVRATGAGALTATLIELNPWGPPTDACLFSWDRHDFDGSLRLRHGG